MSWVKLLLDKTKGSSESVTPSSTSKSFIPKVIDPSEEARKQTIIISLKSLWKNYGSASEKEKESKLEVVFPSFLDLCQKDVEPETFDEIFGNKNHFSDKVSKQLVSKISGFLTEPLQTSNSVEVLKILLPETNYLSVLENIVFKDLGLEGITRASIPSSMLKVLRLFLLLPEEFSLGSEVAVVIDKITSILSRLCHEFKTIEELLESDTYSLIFTLPVTLCPTHNTIVRENILMVFSTVTKYFTNTALTYLIKNESIKFIVKQLTSQISSFQIDYLVLVLSKLLDCLKDSCSISSLLMQEFSSAGGYELFVQALLLVENMDPNYQEQIFSLLIKFVFVGEKDLPISEGLLPYATTSFKSTKFDEVNRVRNLEAVQSLGDYFIRAQNSSARGKSLDKLTSIYAINPCNLLLLQPLRILPKLIEQMENFTFDIKESIVNILIFLATGTILNFVPFQELSSLSCLLAADNPSPSTVSLIYYTISKLINFDDNYKDILKEVGLLSMLVNAIQTFLDKINQTPNKENDKSSKEYYENVINCILILLENKPQNIKVFIERGGSKVLIKLVEIDSARELALKIFISIIKQDSVQVYGNLTELLDLLQTSPKNAYSLKQDVLEAIRKTLIDAPPSGELLSSFRELGGFICIISVLVGLEGAFVEQQEYNAKEERKIQLLETVFKTVTAAFRNSGNREFFVHQIGYSSLADALRLSGILKTAYALRVMETLMELITGERKKKEDLINTSIDNPSALLVILDIMTHTPLKAQIELFEKINLLMRRWENRKKVSQLSPLRSIVLNYKNQIISENPLQSYLLEFIETVGTYFISTSDLRQLFPLMLEPNLPTQFYETFISLSKALYPPWIQFSPNAQYEQSIQYALENTSWPPTTGYSLLCWLYFEQYDDIHHIEFCSLTSDKKLFKKLFFSKGKLYIQTASEHSTVDYNFEQNKWYHITIIHAKSHFKSSQAKVYVDGISCWKGKVSYHSSLVNSLNIIFGSPSSKNNLTNSNSWKLGPFYLLDEPLKGSQILNIFALGPRYTGNFQGNLIPYRNYEILTPPNLKAAQEFDSSLPLGSLDSNSVVSSMPSETHILVAFNAKNVNETTKEMINSATISGHSVAQIAPNQEAFVPAGLSTIISQVDGIVGCLYLIEKAENKQNLIFLVKFLVNLLKFNSRNTRDMELIEGYEILGNLFSFKKEILTPELFDVIFCWISAKELDSKETSSDWIIANPLAFKIILNYDLWKNANLEVQRHLLQKLKRFFGKNPMKKFNLIFARQMNTLYTILYLLREESLPEEIFPYIIDVIYSLLEESFLDSDLHILTNFLIYSLAKSSGKRDTSEKPSRLEGIRIAILEMIWKLLFGSEGELSISKLITVNWIFSFVTYDLDRMTVTTALKILGSLLILRPHFLTKFRQVHGFHLLSDILPFFSNSVEIFYILFSVSLGHPISLTNHDDLEYFSVFKSKEQSIHCIESISMILVMLKELVQTKDSEQNQRVETMFSCLIHLWQTSPEIHEAVRKAEILDQFASLLFMPSKENNEEMITDSNYSLTILSLFTEMILAYNKIYPKGYLFLEQFLLNAPVPLSENVLIQFHTKVLRAICKEIESYSKKEFEIGKYLLANISKISVIFVDKVYQGLFPEAERIFEFIILLLEKLYDDNSFYNNSRSDIQTIYRSLNRIIIFSLTTPKSHSSENLYIITNIIYHQKIILHEHNTDPEFYQILAYYLSKLILDDNQEIRQNSMNIWKLLLLCKLPLCESILKLKLPKGEVIDLFTNGFDKLLQKDANEFSFWMGEPDVVQNMQLCFKAISQIWASFEANEEKNKIENLRNFKTQRQQYLMKKEKNRKILFLQKQKLGVLRNNIITQIQKREQSKFHNFREDSLNRQLYTMKQWEEKHIQMEAIGSVFGKAPSSLDKWKLNTTEGLNRMRKRMERNPNFYIDWPYIPPSEQKEELRIPESADSKPYYETVHISEQQKLYSSVFAKSLLLQRLIRKEAPIATPPISEMRKSDPHELVHTTSQTNINDSISEEVDSMNKEFFEDLSSTYDTTKKEVEENEGPKHILNRFLELGDKIQSIFNCAIIDIDSTRVTNEHQNPLNSIFLFCVNNLYVIEGYIQNPNGDLEEKFDASNVSSQRVIKWSYSDLREALKRNYLLRPSAIEFFSTYGESLLLLFTLNDREEVFKQASKKIGESKGNALGTSPVETLLGTQIDIRVTMQGIEGVMSKLQDLLFKRAELLQKSWQIGQLSNFQYLMALNTLAGRTYNDLTQYPVFPWVLRDYESEELDFTSPETFRDLSKPMGALSPRRAELFKTRFETWIDPEGIVPKFHYGSHYSSAATVLFYLIRLEPFTQQSLKLQGGKFDHSDRIFYSIQQIWNSASDGSTAEVMELIPEFYYFSEFLENRNRFILGRRTQTNIPIDDVYLPPWAKGNPRLFIQKNRQALECDYVSEHLHEWIDLIFGYKQQGKAAEEALNVFYYLTYEGAVNFDALPEEMRASTISQIKNFGQTPTQLFKKPHPKRQPITLPSSVYTHAEHLTPTIVRASGDPVGQIRLVGDKLYVVGLQKILLPRMFNKHLAWGYPDSSIRVLSGDKLVSVINKVHEDYTMTCATCTPTGKILITGGTDSIVIAFRIQKVNGIRRFFLLKYLCGHEAPVTCVAVSRVYSIIVSGSSDKSCIIWDLNHLIYVKRIPLSETPVAICITEAGDIIVATSTLLYVWSINGDLLSSRKVCNSELDGVTVLEVSRGAEWDERNIFVTGHKDGSIKFWSCVFRQVEKDEKAKQEIIPRNESTVGARVTCLYISNDQKKLFTGDFNGQIVEWKFFSPF